MQAVQDQCTTTDEVIAELDKIIQHCIMTNDRAGYFAVLYYCVTCRVKEGILKHEFDDNPRMELLDVVFANRYLEAWGLWKAGKKPTLSWEVAFRNCGSSEAIILQHLLLGINAHINLDLGIATAQVMKGQDIQLIRNDFNRINAILKAMVDRVQDNLGKVSPLFRLLDVYGKNHDELLTGFSIQVAREGAWRFAEDLHLTSGLPFQTCLQMRDQKIAALANRIAHPLGQFLRIMLKTIRTSEWRLPATNIRLLRLS
ncbi:DUF5995 family protein [Rufibacter latericius]|uniref:Uncharacterized protein n=1 Tax=Rufibacter latericius TaxID=2487040 RepID=A0A3M9MUJ0_9BACT|nr:DUF5995 family protein [Rufibacter latericius]RNI29192.1 hypothetical protein EFB08_07150 [Rufibacter latericius]